MRTVRTIVVFLLIGLLLSCGRDRKDSSILPLEENDSYVIRLNDHYLLITNHFDDGTVGVFVGLPDDGVDIIIDSDKLQITHTISENGNVHVIRDIDGSGYPDFRIFRKSNTGQSKLFAIEYTEREIDRGSFESREHILEELMKSGKRTSRKGRGVGRGVAAEGSVP